MEPYRYEPGGVALALFRRFIDEWQASDPEHDLDTILAGAGVDRGMLARGDAAVQIAHYYRAMQLAAGALGHTDFFLRLGSHYDIFDLGILWYALISAANLRRSWDISIGQSTGLLPHPITTRRRVTQEQASILLNLPDAHPEVTAALCDEWLADTWRWICQRLPELTGCADMEVHSHFQAPGHVALYREIFPGRIRFAAPRSALVIPAAFYEQPFSTANPSITGLCYEHSVATMARFARGDSLVDEVRFFLLQNARTPFPSLEETAARFRLPPYTLQRRLAGAGEPFRRITLEIRMVLARQYLLETDFSAQEVSYLVGYEHPASFSRAFLGWFGAPPNCFRRSHHGSRGH